MYKDIRPVVNVIGSHKHLCLFGAVGLNGKQIFRQYDRFNEDIFTTIQSIYIINFQNANCFWIRLHSITDHKTSDSTLKNITMF
jgi:hypothetical protein